MDAGGGASAAGPRASKRARSDGKRDAVEYRAGSVQRVIMHNFMAYDHIEVHPGSTLNIVVGPNGAGKSTIVCAICLGLAGSPNLLGTSLDMSSYIKRDAEEDYGYVEVHLATEAAGRPRRIRRTIRRDRKTSEWRLDDKTASEKTIRELVEGCSIQVGNPCQFLPQFKAREFAAASPQELLMFTQQAIADRGSRALQQELIKAQAEVNRTQSSIRAAMERRAVLQRENEEMRRDVMRFQQSQAHLKKAKEMELLVPWIKYEAVREKMEAAHVECKAAQDALKEARSQTKPLERSREKAGNAVKRCKTETKGARTKLQRVAKEAAALMEKMDNDIDDEKETLKEKLSTAKEQHESNMRERRRLEQEIAAVKREIEKLKSEVDDAAGMDLSKLRKEETAADARVTHLTRQNDDMLSKCGLQEKNVANAKKRLEDLRNLRLRRQEALRTLSMYCGQPGKTLYDLSNWVDHKRQNGEFSGPVYGPLIVDINVRGSAEQAALVETALPAAVRISIVCVSKEDHELLMRESRNKWHVTVSRIDNTPVAANHPCDIAEYDRHGVECWMDQIIEAPKEIMRSLVSRNTVNTWAVGTARTVERDVLQVNKITRLATPERLSTLGQSRHGNRHTWIQSFPTRPAQVLRPAGAEDERQLKNHLDDATTVLGKLRGAATAVQKEMEQAMATKAKISSDLEKLRLCQQRLRSARTRLERRETNLAARPSAAASRAEMERVQAPIHATLVELTRRYADLAIQYGDVKHKEMLAEIGHEEAVCRRVQADARLRQIVAELRRSSREFVEAEQRERALHESFSALKGEATDLKRAAEKSRADAAVDNEKLQSLFANYRGMGVADLESEIQVVRHKASELYTSPDTVTRYEARVRELERADAAIQRDEGVVATQQAAVAELRARWLTPLKMRVADVSAKFSAFMATCGCAGEVLIDEVGDDYENYGINIMVRFRDDGVLERLESTHHSGGEQSLSTFLYILSLQSHTPAPFRLVDEINQNMDTANERRAHMALNGSVGAGMPQYFFFSPQLLDELEYEEHATVLIVNNGPFIDARNVF